MLKPSTSKLEPIRLLIRECLISTSCWLDVLHRRAIPQLQFVTGTLTLLRTLENRFPSLVAGREWKAFRFFVLRGQSQYTCGRMSARLNRRFASALAVFFLIQPLALLGFAGLQMPATNCCKGGSCCRRSHSKSEGSTFTNAPVCGQACHVSVQNASRLPAMAPPASIPTLLERAANQVIAHGSLAVRRPTERSLYQRPPPALN